MRPAVTGRILSSLVPGDIFYIWLTPSGYRIKPLNGGAGYRIPAEFVGPHRQRDGLTGVGTQDETQTLRALVGEEYATEVRQFRLPRGLPTQHHRM